MKDEMMVCPDCNGSGLEFCDCGAAWNPQDQCICGPGDYDMCELCLGREEVGVLSVIPRSEGTSSEGMRRQR